MSSGVPPILSRSQLGETARVDRPAPAGKPGWGVACFLAVVMLGFVWSAFWMHGQRFFDDDYARWVPAAQQQSYGDILAQILIPMPADWGFLDRPVITLFFKLGASLFGQEPAGYFLVKCVIAGLLSGGVYLLTLMCVADHRRWRGQPVSTRDRLMAMTAPLLLATASPTFLSMLWLCDMAVLAELCTAGCFALYLASRRQQDASRARFVGLLLATLLFAWVGFKTKSSVKVVPIAIALHAAASVGLRPWLSRPGASVKRVLPFAMLCVVMVLALVPWAKLGEQPVPEFIGAAAAEDKPTYYWQSFNPQTWKHLVVGEPSWWPLREDAPSPFGLWQVLFPFGIGATILGGIAWIAARRSATMTSTNAQPETPAAPSSARKAPLFMLIWLALVIATYAIYPNVPASLRGRYVVYALTPMCVLIGWLVAHLFARASVKVPACLVVLRVLVALLLLAQCLVATWHTAKAKREIGYGIMLADMTRQHIAEQHAGHTVVYLNGLTDPGYWPNNNGNRFVSFPDGPSFARSTAISEGDRPVLVVLNVPNSMPRLQLQAAIKRPAGWYHDLLGVERDRRVRFIYRWLRQRDMQPR